MKSKKRNHQSWSWILIISFFLLSIFDSRFGILGFICMGAPIYQALRGRGKIHCSKYCPRGSFLGKFLSRISLNHTLPKFMRTKQFKHGLLILMMSMFTLALIHSGFVFEKIAFALFRLMGVSFLVGIVLGIFYKPRSWCQICPMGHGTSLISNLQKK
jgi:membrane-associated HD superfamily phosphohydrolase